MALIYSDILTLRGRKIERVGIENDKAAGGVLVNCGLLKTKG
jgi:hypothetical protein